MMFERVARPSWLQPLHLPSFPTLIVHSPTWSTLPDSPFPLQMLCHPLQIQAYLPYELLAKLHLIHSHLPWIAPQLQLDHRLHSEALVSSEAEDLSPHLQTIILKVGGLGSTLQDDRLLLALVNHHLVSLLVEPHHSGPKRRREVRYTTPVTLAISAANRVAGIATNQTGLLSTTTTVTKAVPVGHTNPHWHWDLQSTQHTENCHQLHLIRCRSLIICGRWLEVSRLQGSRLRQIGSLSLDSSRIFSDSRRPALARITPLGHRDPAKHFPIRCSHRISTLALRANPAHFNNAWYETTPFRRG